MSQETYNQECKRAMEELARNPRVIFLGQTVAFPGSRMFEAFKDIPLEKRIELPLIEDAQMGISIGLSLQGYIPVSVYPRMDFLLCSTNQLVNHLNCCEEMSNGEWKPKVIIRTGIGSTKPLYPGIQHCSDYTEGLRALCKNINVARLERTSQILLEYQKALCSKKSTILIEVPQYE